VRDRAEKTWRPNRPFRRRVSRLRAILGLLGLALLGSGAFLYFHLTDEERLRSYAERWLHDFSGGEVRIAQLRLNPFRGIDLRGVTVAIPEEARFDPHDNTLAGRTIFRARSLYLRLHPFSLLTGNLVVPEIVAVDPELTLIHRLTDDARNWQVLLNQRPQRPPRQAIRLPVLRLRNLRVVQHRLDERGRSAGAAQSLWADAQPASSDSETYDLRIVRVFDMEDPLKTEEGRLRVNMRTLAVAGSVPSMSVEDLAGSAPAHILRQLDVLGLRGYVRAESIRFDPRTGGEARLILRDASLSVPIDEVEKPLPASERFIQFSQVGGTVQVSYGRATLDISGLFRDAPMRLKGTVTFNADGFTVDDLGFDVHVDVRGVTLPVNDEQAPAAERRFAQRWFHLREFVVDYDPRGRADFRLHFQKLPGKDKGIRFVDGLLTARGASARYFRFPYRLYDLSGCIYFRPDGRIELREFTGVHGGGRAVINGIVNGYNNQGLDVNIKATSIELDDDLTRCLDERDRELIAMFNTRARMDLDVQLHRDPKPHGLSLSENPWKAVVDVHFLDGAVRFEDFPYPLEGLAGRLRIQNGGFELDRVRGANGPARVEVSGRVQRGSEGPAVVDLRLDARTVPLDEKLAQAFPPDARLMYERLAPRGQVAVHGRIYTPPESAEVVYDLTASLDGGELSVPQTPVCLTDVHARIGIRPEQLAIESLSGRFGASTVALTGQVGIRPDDQDLSLRVTSQRLLLDETLRGALPEAVRPIWQSVNPGGAVRLDLTYEQKAVVAASTSDSVRLSAPSASPGEAQTDASAGSATLPAGTAASRPTTLPASQPALPEVHYTAIIEPLDCTAMLEAFPLPLTRVHGRFVFTPEGVKFENVSAWHEGMKFELDGRMDMKEAALAGEMSLQIRGLTFSETLRKAVPWRLRRLWYDVKPTGKADISISRLIFSYDARGSQWTAEGAADLDGLTIYVGSELADLTGRVSGRGGMAESVSLDLDFTLSQARVDGRLITEVRGHMARPAGDPRLRITDLRGGFYGGDVLGELEVNYATGRPTFGLSLATRGMSLEEFLNAKRRPDEPPVTTKGTVDGSLALAGRFGDPDSRHGGGSVFIRQAQMARIPLIFSIFQLVHGQRDDNAFEDARFAYAIDGDDVLLQEIDLRGKSLSMVGAGRVNSSTQAMDLTLLVGSAFRLPRMEVLSELVEGVARELMEVHVEGTLEQPQFRAEMVRSVRRALEEVFAARRKPGRR